MALDAIPVEPPREPAQQAEKLWLPNLRENFEFLAGYGPYKNAGYPALANEEDVKPLESREFANFFGAKQSTFTNYKKHFNAKTANYFSVPYEFERAIALRYGFGPTAEFEGAHPGLDHLDLCDRWLRQHWPGWREGEPAQFREAMTQGLRDGLVRPRLSSDPLLLAAIAEVPRAVAARGGCRKASLPSAAAGAAEAEPILGEPLPALNMLEELVSLSALLSPDGVLRVNLNTVIARLEEGPPYLWRLRSARLRLQGVSLRNPLGWRGGDKSMEALGDSSAKAEFVSVPPAFAWRLTDLDLDPLGASFEAVELGTFVGTVAPGAVLTLEVAPIDLTPADSDVEPLGPKQMHLNQAVLQALLGPELLQGRYATVCSQPLGVDHG